MQNLDLESTLIRGKGGVFDVVLDGQLVYSKKAAGRFPLPGEVTEAIRPLLPPSG
jgi:selT/selW/selH-like putative selenoprotein